MEKAAESKQVSGNLSKLRKGLQEKRDEIDNHCLGDLESEKTNLEETKNELNEAKEKLTAMLEGKKLFKVINSDINFEIISFRTIFAAKSA